MRRRTVVVVFGVVVGSSSSCALFTDLGGYSGSTTSDNGDAGVSNDALAPSGDADSTTPPADAYAPSCDGGGACVAPDIVATAQSEPSRIIVVGDWVYWINETISGAVMRCSINDKDCTGSGKAKTIASAQPRPSWIVASATRVFWSCSDDGSVRSAPHDTASGGGGGVTIHVSGFDGLSSVAVSASSFYWAFVPHVYLCPFGADCQNAGTPSGFVYEDDHPSAFLIEGATGYWLSRKLGGSVRSCGSLNCMADNANVIASMTAGAKDLAIDELDAYWVNETSGTVASAKKSNTDGGTTITLASSQNRPSAIALDATDVYWANLGTGNDGTIMRTKKNASADVAPVLVAQNLVKPRGIAVSPSHIYWTTLDGKVMRAAK